MLASSTLSDCLSSAQLSALGLTASSALVTYTTESPAAFCADYWTANGSCVDVNVWAQELNRNLQVPPQSMDRRHGGRPMGFGGPGRNSNDFPRNNQANNSSTDASTTDASTTDASTTNASTTDAAANNITDATQIDACKTARDAVLNKYFCVLASGVGSSAATFTDNALTDLVIDDSDALSIYTACAASLNARCTADAANSSNVNNSSSANTSNNSTTTSVDTAQTDRATECANIAACVAANDGTNCLADFKKQIVNFFKQIALRSANAQNNNAQGQNNQQNGNRGPQNQNQNQNRNGQSFGNQQNGNRGPQNQNRDGQNFGNQQNNQNRGPQGGMQGGNMQGGMPGGMQGNNFRPQQSQSVFGRSN